MKFIYVGIGLIIISAIGVFLFSRNKENSNTFIKPSNAPNELSTLSKQDNQLDYSFKDLKKSAHFESSTPAHGAILAGTPINVVIDFNFDLSDKSRLIIPFWKPTGQIGANDFGVGNWTIDQNKLAIRRNMHPDNSPDGQYSVNYNACWPDGSCHDGNFEFAIDRNLSKNFEDQTGKSKVTVNMSQISFKPQNIRISKGTEVTWVNDDSVEHYVNTDSHQAHTYFPEQNSKALKEGESHTVNFTKAGIYPYHCSAHASEMMGNILVE